MIAFSSPHSDNSPLFPLRFFVSLDRSSSLQSFLIVINELITTLESPGSWMLAVSFSPREAPAHESHGALGSRHSVCLFFFCCQIERDKKAGIALSFSKPAEGIHPLSPSFMIHNTSLLLCFIPRLLSHMRSAGLCRATWEQAPSRNFKRHLSAEA